MTQLSPYTEDKRLKEIESIKELIDEGKTILMGDLNSLSRQDNYDEIILEEMKKNQFDKFGKNKLRYEVIEELGKIGFEDTIKEFIASVPTPINIDKFHFADLRLDYIFAKNVEVKKAEVIRNKETDILSDHYPIKAILE